MKLNSFNAAITATILTGCSATSSGLTGDELYELTHRTYEGVSTHQVLDAVHRLLRLADGDDFTVYRSPSSNTLKASRNWMKYKGIYIEEGNDYWSVDVIENNGVVSVAAKVETEKWGMGLIGTYTSSPIETTALYDVFWARLDYLLGKRDEWMDCDEANARVDQGVTSGTNAALCSSQSLDDNRPLD